MRGLKPLHLDLTSMGNDGVNYLHFVGSPASLDAIVESHAAVPVREGEPETYDILRKEYFGKGTFTRKSRNCLILAYDFRNSVPTEYLTDLLHTYRHVSNLSPPHKGWADFDTRRNYLRN